MVGLSVLLENCTDLSQKRSAQILSKGPIIKPSSPSLPNFSSALGFLDNCFLCKQKLLPGKDIYMYNGDKPFCSVDCRYRQIFMDEQEITTEKSGCTVEYNTCSLAATSSPSTSSSSSSSSSSSRSGKGARTPFAY